MRLIQPNCRVQFTAEDLDFILDVLGPEHPTREHLELLLADEESRALILDDDRLLHAVLEHRGCLRISTHFYFYVLVRNALRHAKLTDRRMADYVAEVLADFSQEERSRLRWSGHPMPLDYFCDMLAALQEVDDTTRFYIRAHVGNASLFLSGVFPDRIRHRCERRGAPGLSYYENLGRSSFLAASDHHLARKYDLDSVYGMLAARFQETRLALNDLGDRLVSLGEPSCATALKWLEPQA